MTHTQGKWENDGGKIIVFLGEDENGPHFREIAEIAEPHDPDEFTIRNSELRANAYLIAAAPELYEALKRAEVLLRATIDFIKNNPVKEYTVHFDEADCDGACLQDDCRIALDSARAALAKAVSNV